MHAAFIYNETFRALNCNTVVISECRVGLVVYAIALKASKTFFFFFFITLGVFRQLSLDTTTGRYVFFR